MPNWVAERGGFEPPVPRTNLRAELRPLLADYLHPRRSISARRESVRLGFGSSSMILKSAGPSLARVIAYVSRNNSAVDSSLRPAACSRNRRRERDRKLEKTREAQSGTILVREMVGQRSPGDEPRVQIVPLRTRIGTCAAYPLRAAPTSLTMALEPG